MDKKESTLNFSDSTFVFEIKLEIILASLYPLSANSDENEISLYIITTCSNIQVMRIKEVITKDKMSSYLDKFSLLVP